MPLRPLQRIAVLAACSVAAFASGAWAAPLTVEVGNVETARGELHVTVYDGAGTWLSDTHRATRRVALARVVGDSIVVPFDLPPGRYAVAVHHDINGNGKMDFTLLRLPKEPYAFSNNVVPRLSQPAFDAAAFDVPDDGLTVTVKLR